VYMCIWRGMRSICYGDMSGDIAWYDARVRGDISGDMPMRRLFK